MFDRRGFLTGAVGAGLVLGAPALVRAAAERPQLKYGTASGSISHNGAAIWTRADRPVQMHVDIARDPDFKQVQKFSGTYGLAEGDFNAKTRLSGLLENTQHFYRVRCESLENPGVLSAPTLGQFKTAPKEALSDIRFCWSGDTAGQGFGIDTKYGGMLTYKSMLDKKPDFLVHSGDQIYADGPLAETKDIGGGRVWTNLLTPGKAKVAETTQEFRENYYYNFLDEHVRAFHANVPVFNQWDDHEVLNDWYPGEMLHEDDRYTEKSVSLLAARSRQAMFDCTPILSPVSGTRQIYRQQSYGPLLDLFFLDMRSYRGPNSRNLQPNKGPETALMGDTQVAWLKAALKASKATWKIICSDMPIGLIVTEWQRDIVDNGANGDGPPLGREHEMAFLLSTIAEEDIKNVHFITSDVHYCASHYYNPAKAQFKNFKPFWEFVSGPLHASTFGPNQLDNTFGPEVKFTGIPADMQQGLSPADGFQFFGVMDIDSVTKVLRVSHHNRVGDEIWSQELRPEGEI